MNDKTKPEKTPYMDKATYNNYEKTMVEKNVKRRGQGLKSIYIRTFEEWCGV